MNEITHKFDRALICLFIKASSAASVGLEFMIPRSGVTCSAH